MHYVKERENHRATITARLGEHIKQIFIAIADLRNACDRIRRALLFESAVDSQSAVWPFGQN